MKKLKIFIIKNIILPILRLYWRIFKPTTFGVKAVIPNPDDNRQILLVRHSYSNSHLWTLPGGGYNPKYETPMNATIREIKEELCVESEIKKKLGEYISNKENKYDNVVIFLTHLKSPQFKLNYEISEFKWISVDKINNFQNISSVALYGINLYIKDLNQKL